MKFQINLEINGADEKRWVSIDHDKSELAQALYIINYFFDIKKIEEIGKGSQVGLKFDNFDDQEKVERFIETLKNKGYEFADIEKENSKISSAKIIIPEKRK